MSNTAILPLALAAAFGLASTALAAATTGQSAFLQHAIQGDTSEIMLGQLAEQQGGTPGVRAFGRTLVHDHSQAKQEAEAVARQMNVSVPTGPLANAETEQTKLASLHGAAFDRSFVNYMVRDHEKDIAQFGREAQGAGPVANLARQSMPVLHKHLAIAESLQRRGA